MRVPVGQISSMCVTHMWRCVVLCCVVLCGVVIDNYDSFAQQFGHVVAVDWRGMGNSSRDRRVPRPCSCCCCTCTCGEFDETSSVDYFVESLFELVAGLRLTNVVLAGHSLG